MEKQKGEAARTKEMCDTNRMREPTTALGRGGSAGRSGSRIKYPACINVIADNDQIKFSSRASCPPGSRRTCLKSGRAYQKRMAAPIVCMANKRSSARLRRQCAMCALRRLSDPVVLSLRCNVAHNASDGTANQQIQHD